MAETTLTRWTPATGFTAFDNASNYLGEHVEAYLVYVKHRDSDLMTLSNWDAIAKALNAAAVEANAPDCVTEHSFNHWAVGYVDQLHLSVDAPESVIREAEALLDALEDYPILDESDLSEREWNAAADYWEQLSPREKVQHAMRERKERHWLAAEHVWVFGRFDWHTLSNHSSEIAEALHERVYSYARE